MKNACIIGYGAIGPIHAAALSRCPEAAVYGICDIRPERAARCREQYNAKIYDSYEQALQDPAIDAVHICTPHYLHAPMALSALRAGKNVVLEKPAAISRQELDELLQAARESDCEICVMLQNRRNSSIELLHSLISGGNLPGQNKDAGGACESDAEQRKDAGDACESDAEQRKDAGDTCESDAEQRKDTGDTCESDAEQRKDAGIPGVKKPGQMKGICAFVTWERTPEYYQADAWRGKWATEGGGLLINQALHTLDLLDWLGGGIKTVRASISTKKLSDVIEVEDTADAAFEMENGAAGLFYASNCYHGNSPVRLEIAFENESFRYADSRLYRITGNQTEILTDDSGTIAGKDYWGSGHAKVIDSFYRGEKTGYVTLEEAAHVMKVLFAFYESAKEGRRITV